VYNTEEGADLQNVCLRSQNRDYYHGGYMKCKSIKARLAVFTIFFAVPLVIAQPVVMKNVGTKSESNKEVTTQSHQEKKFTSDTEMLNDVLGTIKEELKQSDGDAYYVECTYKMHNNKPISASTKTYHTEYRKKPTRTETKFTSHHSNAHQVVEPNQIIEVIYKPSIRPKQVSVITKDPSKPNRRIASKNVTLAQSLLA
jgi:hypothetical protein